MTRQLAIGAVFGFVCAIGLLAYLEHAATTPPAPPPAEPKIEVPLLVPDGPMPAHKRGLPLNHRATTLVTPPTMVQISDGGA